MKAKRGNFLMSWAMKLEIEQKVPSYPRRTFDLKYITNLWCTRIPLILLYLCPFLHASCFMLYDAFKLYDAELWDIDNTFNSTPYKNWTYGPDNSREITSNSYVTFGRIRLAMLNACLPVCIII